MVHVKPPALVLVLSLAAALVSPLALSACIDNSCAGQDASFRCTPAPDTESLSDTDTDTDTDTDGDPATATDGGGGSDGAEPAQEPPREDPKKAPR